MKKSHVIPIIFICILFSFMDLKAYGQEKRDSLDSDKETFFNVSLSYHLINTWRLGGGFNILKNKKHRFSVIGYFTHSYMLRSRYIGFDVGAQYYYGKKWCLITGVYYSMLINTKRQFENNGPNPATHILSLTTPKIELGGALSIRKWDFVLSMFMDTFTYQKGIYFNGGEVSSSYWSIFFTPNLSVNFKF